ncbi:MAG: peptidoglycan recognition family protein [Candidatus Competibacteraceae bacterium]|nr:peptidoglycan recognition family protein [Candidatus Competibacteraceae bacterium]
MRRAAWGQKTPKYLSMDEDWDYDTIVIHHSGNSGAKVPAEIEKKHMSDQNWDDVGYHFLIQPNGAIHEGRYLTFKGSHVEKANTKKIGILIMGDFEHQWWDFDDDPTTKQLSAAESLIKTLKSAFPTVTKLGGHRDYKPGTECPGGELYKKLPGMRANTTLGGP